MRVLITENKYYNLIEKYILDGYPEVKNVTFTKKDVYLASGDKNGRKIVTRDIIVLGFISGQMTHSPTWNLRHIRQDINNVFGLDIGKYGSDWDIDYKIASLTGNKDV